MGLLVFEAGYLARITAWGSPLLPSEAAHALHVASGYKADPPETWPLNMGAGEIREFPYATVVAVADEDGISCSYLVTRKLEYMIGREVGEAQPDPSLAAHVPAMRRRQPVAAEMVPYLGKVTAVWEDPEDGKRYLMVRDPVDCGTEPVDPDEVRIAPDERDKARDLARSGRSGPQISEEMGTPLRTVQRWCGDLLPARGGKRLPGGAETSRATRYRRAQEARARQEP